MNMNVCQTKESEVKCKSCGNDTLDAFLGGVVWLVS
jgi:hypothetical protein